MKLNVRRNSLSNITSYASYPSMVGFFVPYMDENRLPKIVSGL
jgi:hypothetical protein